MAVMTTPQSTEQAPPFIHLDHVSMRFGMQQVLNDIDLPYRAARRLSFSAKAVAAKR